MLKDEKQYAMTDLILQEVYLIDQELNVDFWFKKNTAQNQIDNAHSFVIIKFVLRSGEERSWVPVPMFILYKIKM
ncbi:hypothetical protein [Sedimentibacter sp.]|uniref:hypothetical protein n=1 Tax=Sedimentibacter sp. TaxID=1960295 RepID=UPI0028AF008D|nr:hypothetical protein [Sedimentibacter sp.]